MSDIKDVLLAVGRLEGKIDGMDSHIRAVSANTKEIRDKLETHEKKNDAHGVDAVDKSDKRRYLWMGAAIALGGLLGPYLWEGFRARLVPPTVAAEVRP